MDRRALLLDLAREVRDMDSELWALRREVEELREYRDKYLDLLNSSIEHNERMLGNVLEACLDPNSNLQQMLRKQ